MEALQGEKAGLCIGLGARVKPMLYFEVDKGKLLKISERTYHLHLCNILSVKQQMGSQAGGNAEVVSLGAGGDI